MDLSAEYIKMCEKAEDIQSQFIEFSDCDFYVLHGEVQQLNDPQRVGRKILGASWMPREDQLKQMVRALDKILDWKNSIVKVDDESNLDSSEKVLISLYMITEFGKIWNGEEWVKQDTVGKD